MTGNTIKRLGDKALGLLEQSGIYIMKDKSGKILYVGKAINLKRRVSSYFHGIENHNPKTAALVSQINDFDVILTQNELEALLLENNLIKENKPKYNILLKDDKNYPFIKITTNEDYPQITLVRKRAKDKAKYFGPYFGFSARSAIEAVSRAFALPSCNNASPKEGKRPCLNFRIKRCVGLCAGEISKEDYRETIKQVIAFFEGDIEGVADTIKQQMNFASGNLNFEKAAALRDRMNAVLALKEKQYAVSGLRQNGDYMSFVKGENQVCVFSLKVRAGKMSGERADFYPASDADDEGAFFGEYIKRFYATYKEDIPNKICVNSDVEDIKNIVSFLEVLRGGRVRITNPKSGNDLQLLNMSISNAHERLLHYEGKTNKGARAIYELSNVLGLKSAPSIIEIYDISEISGTGMVCGMAVFVDGICDKSKYRKFKIENAKSGDDSNAMREALSRRINRYKEGDESFTPLPDIIFADGGIIQVRALAGVIKDAKLNISVFGLKKDNKHKTKAIVFENGREIMLSKYPAVFSFCGKMQEEAHRFAIEYHRKLRAKKSLLSELTEIEGIGKTRAMSLMRHFKSLSAIKSASVDEIKKVKGMNVKAALALKEYFESEPSN